jgi:hypothetical protein
MPLTHIIHDGSWRNRQDAKRDGCAEPREAEAYLKQYVEVSQREPALRHAVGSHAACRSGVSAVAVEALMNNVG